MDKELADKWSAAVDSLLNMPHTKRKHFALMVLHLAKCYTDSEHNKAVVLISDDDALMTFSAGADEMEAAEMVQIAHEIMGAVNMADAPPKEMFN